jgi:hypothetical protein
LQFDVIVNLSHIVEVSTARLNQMSHQEIEETFHRMGAIIQEVPCRGQLTRQTRSTTVSTVPPVVLQLRLDWSFPRYTVVLVTATLPGGFLPDAPSGASSLEDVSSRRASLSEVLHLPMHQHQEGQDRHHEDPHLDQHQY